MIILGIAFLSDASACLVKDGKLVAAISEERINRIKLWNGVPYKAIKKVLEIGGISMDEVDLIATHGQAPLTPEPMEFDKKREAIDNSDLPPFTKQAQVEAINARYQKEKDVLGNRTPAYLSELSDLGKPLFVTSHHMAHAACAYFGSPWDACYVLTADGWGEDASSTLSWADNGKFDPIGRTSTFNSLGYFYGSITKALGFIPHRHEGKVLGLAAYERGDSDIYPMIRDMISYDATSRSFVGCMENGIYKPQYANEELDKCIRGFSREEVASAAQRRLEEVVCEAIRDIGGSKLRIALAGGLFANVKLNQRINELYNVDEVYVFPSMGDGGLSVGAAWLAYKEKTDNRPEPLSSALLGNNIDEDEIKAAIENSDLKYTKPNEITKTVAELLAAGDVVVRVGGSMEFGPRALGGRSILYKCDEPDVNNWLNDRLKRSEFMPFAPATLAEFAHEHYVGLDGGKHSSPFMTMTFECTKKMIEESPAAVHVDGTARPQIIHHEMYPDFHEILSAYHDLTGQVSLINTSFNMHEEPIVCTASDAIRAFNASLLPWLAIGDYLIQGKVAER
ncbi:MAG: carbamoyltransferase C-terminal domain-containing protein [Burkholderiales bacterium]|nr:carbamoyltransferase C-terminal domain-containing protein [Burkholderiales bacterium]